MEKIDGERPPDQATAMSIHVRGSILSLVVTLVSRIHAANVDLPATFVLQFDWSSHLVATAAMAVLAALGGTLLVRNRLTNDSSVSTEAQAGRQEFKTDQEKVCDLVDDNGGRMKQSEIVNSVDWSKAKVSRLLAELEDDEQITKLRLGRENLVCLPGHEPTASKSTDGSNNP